jgi:hypothetical protein
MKVPGKFKVCPYCGKSVQFGLIGWRFNVVFWSIAILSIVMGISGPISSGIAGGVAFTFGFGLKQTKT